MSSIISKLARRIIEPKDVVRYFRYRSPLSKTDIKDIKSTLKSMSRDDIQDLLSKPKEQLTNKEFDLVMYAGTTFPEFGFPNKTMAQMEPKELRKLKQNVNQTVRDIMAGKNLEVVEGSKLVEFEPGKLRMTESPLLGGKLKRDKGKEKFTSVKTSEIKKGLEEEEFYQPSFLFEEDVRNKKAGGGMLQDDIERIGYYNGGRSNLQQDFIDSNEGFINRLAKLSQEDVKMPKDRDRFIQEEITIKSNLANDLGLSSFDKEYYNNQLKLKVREIAEDRNPMLSTRQVRSDGGSMLKPDYIDIDGDGNKTEPIKEAAKQAKERDGMAEGGEMNEQMSMIMNNEQELPMESEMPMESDEEMEDNYIDFILDEALTEEEEDMLMSKLEQDEQLSMLFDKVVEVASEFAGSGPVEGPGTGVSDSIPARLSDGEFVFTAKAVEEIGADNLMAMMKDAEMKADERQGMANGGEMDEETVVVKGDNEPARQQIRVVKETVDSAGRMLQDEDEISKGIKANMMLDPNQQHVRS